MFEFRLVTQSITRVSDMYWGSYHKYPEVQESLIASSNPAYLELGRRILVFKNRDDAETGLASGKFGVYAGISHDKYFVTYDWNEQLNLLSSFRLMKKSCIFDYYTAFGFQKFSPYTELFSHYALQLVYIVNYVIDNILLFLDKISGARYHAVLV